MLKGQSLKEKYSILFLVILVSELLVSCFAESISRPVIVCKRAGVGLYFLNYGENADLSINFENFGKTLNETYEFHSYDKNNLTINHSNRNFITKRIILINMRIQRAELKFLPDGITDIFPNIWERSVELWTFGTV